MTEWLSPIKNNKIDQKIDFHALHLEHKKVEIIFVSMQYVQHEERFNT
jgi:hypothetical protein